MHVSILIATYQRPDLLIRAVESVLKQTHSDWDLTIINDDPDEIVGGQKDSRIKVFNNRVNQGKEYGDMAHLRTFLKYHCEGEAFVYLCDDDYWPQSDLLERQTALLTEDPTLAFVLGGMGVIDIKGGKGFNQRAFPAGPMSGSEYIALLSEDPANRNIVSGACLFRTETFKRAGALERAHGVRWQAGYALTVAPALLGGVHYINEPCVTTTEDATSASYGGTQMGHMLDALNSVAAGFGEVQSEARNKLSTSIILIYVCNKIGFKLGYGFAVPDMDAQFNPCISAQEFLYTADTYGVTLPRKVKFLIESSDDEAMRLDWAWLMSMCKS